MFNIIDSKDSTIVKIVSFWFPNTQSYQCGCSFDGDI